MDLYPYQRKSVEWLSKRHRAVLGSDMGTGKTAIAIRSALEIYRTSFDTPCCAWIICPAGLKGNWEREIRLWDELVSDGIGIRTLQKKTDTPDNGPWNIMSYEVAVSVLSRPISHLPKIVIIDESHALKNLRAKRTKAILGKESPIRKVPYVHLLTGTPFPNNITDCYAPFNFCLHGKLGKWRAFCEQFAYVQETRFGLKIWGTKQNMLPALKVVVSPILRRDTVEEHLTELPDFQDILIPLEHSKWSKAISSEMEGHWEEISASIEGHKRIPDDGNLSTLRRDLAITKVEAATEFVSNLLEQGESVVVFAHHREVVRRITEALAKDYSVGSIFGDTSISNRETSISAFRAGTAQCLICSIRAAGVGLNLQKAHIAVFIEEDWSPSAMSQAKARIRRIGQKSFCLYYYLLYPESIDTKVHQVVERKAKDIAKFWDVNVKPEEEINWDEKEDAGSNIHRPSGL